MIDAAGGMMTFGGAGYDGDTLEVPLAQADRGRRGRPGGGYWLVASDGGIFSFGNAAVLRLDGRHPLNKPIVGMAATPDGGGYWLVASDGGHLRLRRRAVLGSTGGIALNQPIVGMAATPDGRGYWLVASDGGIFAFGDAQFWGSTGSIAPQQAHRRHGGHGGRQRLLAGGLRRRHLHLRRRAVLGSTGGIALNEPIVGMAPHARRRRLLAGRPGRRRLHLRRRRVLGERPVAPAPAPLPAAPLERHPPGGGIINEAPGPQATHQGGLRVAFAGDSLVSTRASTSGQTIPPYAVDDGAAAAAASPTARPTMPWGTPTPLYVSPAACALWARSCSGSSRVPSRRDGDPDRVLGDPEPPVRRELPTLADPDYLAYIEANLEEAVQIAHSDGGAVILSTSPYFADGTPSTWSTTTTRSSTGGGAVPLRVDRRLYTVLDPGGAYASVVERHRGPGRDGSHHRRRRWTTSLSRRSTRSSPTSPGRSTPAPPRRAPGS